MKSLLIRISCSQRNSAAFQTSYAILSCRTTCCQSIGSPSSVHSRRAADVPTSHLCQPAGDTAAFPLRVGAVAAPPVVVDSDDDGTAPVAGRRW